MSGVSFATLTGQGGGERIEAIGIGDGIACAWNAAAARSPARYICFLQPGDQIEETYLEKCLFYLELASLDVAGVGNCMVPSCTGRAIFLRALLARNVSGSAVIRRETLIRAAASTAPSRLPF